MIRSSLRGLALASDSDSGSGSSSGLRLGSGVGELENEEQMLQLVLWSVLRSPSNVSPLAMTRD